MKVLTPLQKLPKNVEVWANYLLPKALQSCPKSIKSPNLVTLSVSCFWSSNTDMFKPIWLKFVQSCGDLIPNWSIIVHFEISITLIGILTYVWHLYRNLLLQSMHMIWALKKYSCDVFLTWGVPVLKGDYKCLISSGFVALSYKVFTFASSMANFKHPVGKVIIYLFHSSMQSQRGFKVKAENIHYREASPWGILPVRMNW